MLHSLDDGTSENTEKKSKLCVCMCEDLNFMIY